MKNCEICHTPFRPDRKTAKYCNPKCNQQAKINRARKEVVFYAGNCVVCATSFITVRKVVECCSRKCSQANWIANNKEQHKKKCHDNYLAHREQKLANARKWTKANPSFVLEKRARRRAVALQATLKGYSKELKAVYKNRPEGYHVDHIIPLNHPDVCGLHVPWNLQYLTAKDNIKKSNRF